MDSRAPVLTGCVAGAVLLERRRGNRVLRPPAQTRSPALALPFPHCEQVDGQCPTLALLTVLPPPQVPCRQPGAHTHVQVREAHSTEFCCQEALERNKGVTSQTQPQGAVWARPVPPLLWTHLGEMQPAAAEASGQAAGGRCTAARVEFLGFPRGSTQRTSTVPTSTASREAPTLMGAPSFCQRNWERGPCR